MQKMLVYLAICCLVFVGEFCVPVLTENPVETTTDEYDKRVKLLTGGSTVPTCQENGNDFGECVKLMMTAIQPHITAGIPELNIPPIEPLQLNSTSFRFKFGAVSGRLHMKNASIYGVSTVEMKKVDFKVENGLTKFKMLSFVPKIHAIGNYKATVSINNQFNFKPQGTFNLTLYNIDFIMTSEGKLIEKDGHKFLRLHKIDANPKIGDMDIDVTGIFNEPELNEFALNVGKQYWREVYRVMLPETRDYWAPLMMRLLNEALSLIPYDVFVKNQ